MEPHFHPPEGDPFRPAFPSLPIVTPDKPRLTPREKYGGLFYLGIGGLVVTLALVGYFGYGVWAMRGVWGNIFVLHDESRPAAERIQAAFTLSHDSRVNQRQYWDMCLRKPLPPLARYLLAESLDVEAATADPRGYAVAVAKSPDWPDWLRLLLTIPMAEAAVAGMEFPREPLEILGRHPDPIIGLWADFVLANGRTRDPDAVRKLERACEQEGPNRDLGCLLVRATRLDGHPIEQKKALIEAKAWIRAHHPQAVTIWSGWAVEGERIVPKPVP